MGVKLLLIIITFLYFLLLGFFLLGLFFPNQKTIAQKLTASVVIAARNEEKNIGAILNDLVHQTYPTELYEVIIINDGSEDGTGDIVESYSRQYPLVRHISVLVDNQNGLSAKKNALNQGIQASQNELILTTDADCRVKSTWLETMTSYFAQEVGMVVGFSQLGDPRKKYSLWENLQAVDFLSLMGAAQGSINFRCPLAGSGQNIAYRKKVFEQVNGFQKIKDRISGDDVLLLQLVHKLTNWKIRFAPSFASFNWTNPEKTIKAFLNQRKRWASNGSVQLQLNMMFFIFLSIMFLANAILFFGLPVYFLRHHSILLPIICLASKFFIEFLILLKAASVYHRKDLIKYFPLWVIAQMPYVIFTGLLGTFGHFKWKDRKHFQALTTFRINR